MEIFIKRLFYKLHSFRFRLKVYVFIGICFFLLTTVLSMAQAYFDGPFTYIRSDGRAYYIYLPSLFIDGDLDFYNEIHNPWNLKYMPLNPADRTELGYIKNRYPIGFALSIMPAFLSAHISSLALNQMKESRFFEPNGYTLLYQLFCAIFIMMLGILSLVMIDSMLVGYFNIDAKNAGLAVIAFWAGSHYAYYFFREPFMVHIVSGFWVTFVIFLTYKVEECIKQKRFPACLLFVIVFAFSMSLICRPTNAFLSIFLFYLLFIIRKNGFIKQIIKMSPFFILAVSPIFLQMIVWYITSGHFIYYSYGNYGFDWLSPALWQTLFSSRHGLFFWSPCLVLSFLGILWYLKNDTVAKKLLFLYLIAFCVLWYANSAWSWWWFGDSFGGRSFLELHGLFIIGLAFFFEFLRNAPGKIKFISIFFLFFCFLYNYILMGLYIASRIPRGDYLI